MLFLCHISTGLRARNSSTGPQPSSLQWKYTEGLSVIRQKLLSSSHTARQQCLNEGKISRRSPEPPRNRDGEQHVVWLIWRRRRKRYKSGLDEEDRLWRATDGNPYEALNYPQKGSTAFTTRASMENHLNPSLIIFRLSVKHINVILKRSRIMKWATTRVKDLPH